MDKLRSLIEQDSSWLVLKEYADRIDAYKATDLGLAIGNAKSLLETVSHEICARKNVALQENSSVNGQIKTAFGALGFSASDHTSQVSSALATIGQRVGELRNSIDSAAHGGTAKDIEARKEVVDSFSGEFLLNSTELIACLMIQYATAGRPANAEKQKRNYLDNRNFNESWDETYGEFEMGAYSYPASEILFNVDEQAYSTELRAFAGGAE